MENLWNKENFHKITKILKEKGLENWPKLCVELKINKGDPAWGVKKAYYSTGVVADYYDIEEYPRYDKIKNVVVVENPFTTAQQIVNNHYANPDFPVFGPFIQINAEVARKILVLGLP